MSALPRRHSAIGPIRQAAVERVVGWREEGSIGRGARLATATLACPACDVPVALPPGAFPPTHAVACPFCGTHGAIRDFLAFDSPARPARVEVRITLRASATAPAS